jgi:hypothetical protein
VAGDSSPGGRRLRPRGLALAIPKVGRFKCPSGVGPETFCLWPETPGWHAEAGDSGPQGPETPVCLAGLGFAKGSDGSVTRLELGRRLLSLAGDSGPGVT